MFSIIEEAKESILDFSQETVKELLTVNRNFILFYFYFVYNINTK